MWYCLGMITEELQEFIEENEFVRVSGDMFKCPGGHFWHIDDIADALWTEQNDKARDSVDWLT